MGYFEALKDNIRIEKIGCNNYYFPQCKTCGEEVKSLSYIPTQKYTCNRCKVINYMADKERQVESSFESKEKKFKNAVERIKKVTRNFEKYKYAIETVYNKLHTHGWFDSTEEIMVAIELVKNKVKARHHVKFGIYEVDFLLTEMKIILEVDGKVFHTKNTKEKENVRDSLILITLGSGWQVVRIGDDLINQNITRLTTAISSVVKKRNEILKNHGGTIPEWYSDRVVI